MSIGRTRYYTLIASLPPLPRFDRAERLPINRERLDERLGMLEPEDAEAVRVAEGYLHWQRQPAERTDTQVVAFFDQIRRQARHPTLEEIITYRMTERTLMVALRRRHRGLSAPEPGEPWGVGPWVRHVERNWDAPEFRLAPVFPWLGEARRLLEAEESAALQRLLMGLIWDQLERLAERDPFSFDFLLTYLFRWDILNRWLSYDRRLARKRFENLLAEATREHRRIFE